MDTYDSEQQEHQKQVPTTFIGDVGRPFTRPRQKLCVALVMTAYSLVMGIVLGLTLWALYWVTISATNLLWVDGVATAVGMLEQAGYESWWLPLCLCALGGLVTGLWLAHFGGAPRPINAVLTSVKQTGGYNFEHPLASVITMILPFIFGGSIGLVAGILGVLAAAGTKIGRVLKQAGLEIKQASSFAVHVVLGAAVKASRSSNRTLYRSGSPAQSDKTLPLSNYDFRRGFKALLYGAVAVGTIAGIILLATVLGNPIGVSVLIPRFEQLSFGSNQLWWALPCLAAGYLGALLFNSSNAFFARVSSRFSRYGILMTVLAGAALGCTYTPLPCVLFSGQVQSTVLMETWQTVGSTALLATGFLKCVVTPLCLNFGWRGGHFFPCAFAGMSLGFGLAALLGINPIYAVTLTTAVLLAAIQRQPLLILLLLLLCFPVQSIPWLALACIIGAKLPMPKRILPYAARSFSATLHSRIRTELSVPLKW